MSNWLEDEEHKKLLKDQEISLRVQREEAVHTHLRQFYDLCLRVNGFRHDALSIDRLKVECKLSRQSRTDGYQSFHTVDERRGICISCPNQDETVIDVVIKKHKRDVYWLDDVPPGDYSSDEERVVIRNTCALQELIDWREDQIIQLIQWLLLESEVIKGSIPGKEIKNELAEAEAKKAKDEAEAACLALEAKAKRRALEAEKRRALEAAAKGRTLWRLFIGCSVAGIIIFLVFYFFRPTLGEDEAYVRIGPGEFNMGCSPDDGECDADEKPTHPVRISRAYEIGKYEVTQRQWEAVMGSNPSQFKGATLPVAQISWQDVQMFLGRLNARKDGHRYRLPTEAEWEYAARGGTTGKHTGPLESVAWYDGNTSHWYSIGFGWFGWQTHKVGKKLANRYGLHDMQGNAWEFCEDWYSKNSYAVGLVEDPRGPSSGTHRVVRGGSWYNAPRLLRVSQRLGVVPDGREGMTIGFRIVRE